MYILIYKMNCDTDDHINDYIRFCYGKHYETLINGGAIYDTIKPTDYSLNDSDTHLSNMIPEMQQKTSHITNLFKKYKQNAGDEILRINMHDNITSDNSSIVFNRPINSKSLILFPLYEYNDAATLRKYIDNIAFKDKTNKMVFRGVTTGTYNKRCKIVCENINLHPDIDIGFRDLRQGYEKYRHMKKYLKSSMTIQEQLHYKFILCLEGNDLSYAFPWVLGSNSCPLHTYPFTYESHIFVGLKEWVHFVPIKQDGSDLLQKYEWCLNNLDKCEEIANNSKKYMENYRNIELHEKIQKRMVELYSLRGFTQEMYLIRWILLYKILLNRYPDLISNKVIPTDENSARDKFNDILKSAEFLDNNRRAAKNFTYDNVSGNIIIDLPTEKLTINIYNIAFYNNKSDITKSIIEMATYCFNKKIKPTNVIYIKGSFHILEYVYEEQTFMALYIAFKRGYYEYCDSEFMVYHKLNADTLDYTFLACIYYKLLLNRHPDKYEIQLYENNAAGLMNIYNSVEFYDLNDKVNCDIINDKQLIFFDYQTFANPFLSLIEENTHYKYSIHSINYNITDEALLKINRYFNYNDKYFVLINDSAVLMYVNDLNNYYAILLESLNSTTLTVKNKIDPKYYRLLVNQLYLNILYRPVDDEAREHLFEKLSKNETFDFNNLIYDLYSSNEHCAKLSYKSRLSHLYNDHVVNEELATIIATHKKNSKNMSIKYYGSFGTCGYSICCKLIIYALYIFGIDIQFTPIHTNNIPDQICIYDSLVLYLSNNKINDYDIVVVHSVPDAWKNVANLEYPKKCYGITVWETDRLPKEWVGYMAVADMISCPCKWNKDVFEKDITDIPIVHVNHPIYSLNDNRDDIYMDNIFERFNITESTYIFYTINEYNGRKGVSELIDLYFDIFTENDDVFLFVKTSGDIRNKEALEYVKNVKQKYNKNLKFYLTHNILSEEQINSIHYKCHCYVSYTKGEGTGYTSCQAALFMKPIIIGNYSASKEYLKYASLVDVDVQPAIYCDLHYSRHQIYCTGNTCKYNKWYDKTYQNWGIPKRDEFAQQMLRHYNNKIKTGNSETKSFIQNTFSFDNVANDFYNSFIDLLNINKALNKNLDIETSEINDNNGTITLPIGLEKYMKNNISSYSFDFV